MANIISLHLHRVTGIEVSAITERKNDNGGILYASRTIAIALDDGSTFEIALFANPQEDTDASSLLDLKV
jgi:hypothetical protein